ncbi:response regulator [Acidobacteriota bacterium]
MPKKILIVDNDDFYIEIISTTIKLFLRQQVLSAGTVDEAWGTVTEEKPDLIIVNLDIAGRIGVDLVERLQDDAETKTLPVLALSSTEDKKDEALGLGCVAFLHKPFKTRDLESEIVRLLQLA